MSPRPHELMPSHDLMPECPPLPSSSHIFLTSYFLLTPDDLMLLCSHVLTSLCPPLPSCPDIFLPSISSCPHALCFHAFTPLCPYALMPLCLYALMFLRFPSSSHFLPQSPFPHFSFSHFPSLPNLAFFPLSLSFQSPSVPFSSFPFSSPLSVTLLRVWLVFRFDRYHLVQVISLEFRSIPRYLPCTHMPLLIRGPDADYRHYRRSRSSSIGETLPVLEFQVRVGHSY